MREKPHKVKCFFFLWDVVTILPMPDELKNFIPSGPEPTPPTFIPPNWFPREIDEEPKNPEEEADPITIPSDDFDPEDTPDPEDSPEPETEPLTLPLPVQVGVGVAADKLVRRFGTRCKKPATELFRANSDTPKKVVNEQKYHRKRPCKYGQEPIVSYSQKRKTIAVILVPGEVRFGRNERVVESRTWRLYRSEIGERGTVEVNGKRPRQKGIEIELLVPQVPTRGTIISSGSVGSWRPIDLQVSAVLSSAGRGELVKIWKKTGLQWMDLYWQSIGGRLPSDNDTWWRSCLFRVIEIGRRRHCRCPDGSKCRKTRIVKDDSAL